jgi:hypothetical protein
MGGMESSQAALNQLKAGKHFGFIACTDDHYGYPAGYGHGITAVIADRLDRESIFSAIKKRHTYAATGDRIKVAFRVNEGIMGDFIKAADSVKISFEVEAKDKLQSVEIYKNGKLFVPWSAIDFERQSPEENRHLLKIEWGWDMIASKEITKWKIRLRCENGELNDMTPAFCGGAASVTEMNMLDRVDESSWRISSYTSRKNTCPVNSVSFFWNGDADTKIRLDIEGENPSFRKQLSFAKKDLLDKDIYEAAFDRFSSPKLKVHALIPSNEYAFSGELNDNTVRYGDFYFLKATQQNGQMAWASPIWIKQ